MILGFDVGPATAPWLRAAGLALLHFVWVGAAIGGLAGIARRRMSAASPEARYRAAAGWLVAMAAAPVLLLAVFAILALGDFDAASGVLGSTRDAAAAMPVDRAVDGGAEGGAVPIADRGSSAARAFDALLMFVPGVWAAGALIKHALLLLGWSATARWRREARPVDDPQLERALRRWSRALGITKEVAIAWSDRVVTPVLVGVVRPMVLLPATLATGWIPERLEMVLLHELAHVHRRDLLVQWGQRVVEGLLFFHPEVFRISRWLSLERERCCDALVVRHARGSVESYVHTLVALADDRRGGPARGVRAALADRQLVSRIRTLLHREEIPMRSTSVPAITAALVALGFALSGTVTSRACPPEERVAPAAPVPPAAPLAPSARMPVAPSARVTEWFAPAVPVPPTPPSAVSPPSAVPPPAAPKSPVWKQPPVPDVRFAPDAFFGPDTAPAPFPPGIGDASDPHFPGPAPRSRVGGEARFFPRPEAPPAAGFLKRRPKGGEGEAIFGRLQSGNAAGGASPAVGFLKRRPKGDEGEAFFGRRPAGAASPAVGFSKRRPKGDDGEAFFGRLQPGAESPRAGSPFGTLRRAPSAQESHGPFGSAAAPMPAPGDSGFGSSRSAGEREKWSAYWREYWRRHFEAEARGSEARDVRAHPYGTPAPQAVEAGKRRDLRTL